MRWLALFGLLIVGLAASPALARQGGPVADLPLEELALVRVRAVSMLEERAVEAPGVVTIITRHELDLFGAGDLADALDRVVGVGRVTNFYQRELISVRADALTTASNHVLLLLDGRPMRETQFGGANTDVFRMFPLEALDHIEVIRGPGSVLHGSGAFSGVVNLVTRRFDRPSASLVSSGGSFRTLSSAATAGAPFKDGSARLGVSFLNSDGWPQTFTDDYRRRRTVSLDVAGGAVDAAVDWRELSAHVLFLADREELFVPIPSFPQGLRAFSRLFGNVSLQHAVNDALTSTTHVTFTNVHTPGYTFAPGTAQRSEISGYANDAVLEETLTLTPSGRWDLVVGGLVNHLSSENRTDASITMAAEKTWWSGYASWRIRPMADVHVSGGAQILHSNTDDLTAVPRLGAVWAKASGWGVKALYGQAYRAPASLETDTNIPWLLVGNPDLEAEVVGTADVEVFHATSTHSVSLALYDSRQKGLIRPDPSTTPGTFRNSGTFHAKGIELMGRFAPSAQWYVTGSVAIQTSTLDGTLDDVTPFPEGIARCGVGFAPARGVSIGIHDTWYGRPADVSIVRPSRRLDNPVPTATHWLEGQVRVDLGRFAHSRQARGVTLFVRGENLLDQDFWAPEFTARQINSIPGRSGRAFQAGLACDWNGPGRSLE